MAHEQFNCSYGLNPSYRAALDESPLVIAGVDAENDVRIVELREHRFFIATLFQPQLQSRSGTPHPLLVAFLEAAKKTI